MVDRRIWLAPRAIALHIVILIIIPAFAALCDWQVHRALGGNSLSWAYVFEWPIFGGYAMYMWWRILHEEPLNIESSTAAPANGAVAAGMAHAESSGPGGAEGDDELVAYNRYLAELAERGKPKRWR
ncbi:MAG TPA: hypothetical protein VGG38_02145 [Acidimicrobiales bacterium]